MERKLYRSRSNRMIAGVCGGLGNYFQIDPTIVRVLFALLTAFGGSGGILYLVLMFVVPEEPEVTSVVEPPAVVSPADSVVEEETPPTIDA